MARELIGSALFAVDDADSCAADETGFPDRLNRLKGGSARCHHVFDQTDQLTRFAYTFELVRGAVPFCLLAHDQERQPRRKRGGGGECNRTELRRGDADGLGLVLGDGDGDLLADGTEQLGHSLEAVLVEVVLGMPARAQDEIALEIGALDQHLDQILLVHDPSGLARARSSRPCLSSSSAAASSGPSSSSVPSAK